MPTKIENLTHRPVLLRCNSGETLRIAPKAVSVDVLDADLKNNPAIQKLIDRRIVALRETEETLAGKEKKVATRKGTKGKPKKGTKGKPKKGTKTKPKEETMVKPREETKAKPRK